MATFKSNYTLRWNSEELIRRVPNILTKYGKALDQQFKEEIKTAQFDWPRQTKRKNGTVVGSPRNIVDTGAFLNSQQRDRPSLTELRFSWGGDGGVDYAGRILKGEDDKGRPARDWIKPALEAVPLDEFFREEWKKLEKKKL